MSAGLLGRFGMSLAVMLLASVVNVVRGEMVLTNGNETATGELQEWSAAVHVDEYNQLDQCLPQPGYPEIYHHTLVFQLLPDQINSGTGLIICYSGQLDWKNHDKGIVTNIPYRVNNVPGNALGHRCEKARGEYGKRCEHEKDPVKAERCERFAAWSWHGFQFVEDPVTGNIVISLSTTSQNQKFIIPRKHFTEMYSGRLFLNLASWDVLRSNLSSRIGPGVMSSDFCVEPDCENYKFFEKNENNGAYLRNHMGIWALGLDILPKDPTATELDFFVIRSQCSEMGASVMHPSEYAVNALPKPKYKKIKAKGNSAAEYNILENSTIFLRGKVQENANTFRIMLTVIHDYEDFTCGIADPLESKVRSIMLKYDFDLQKVVMQKEYNDANSPTKVSMDETVNQKEILMHRGQNILMNIRALADSFQMDINCGPAKIYPVDDRLPFNRRLTIESEGIDIYNFTMPEAQSKVVKSAIGNSNWQPENNGIPIAAGRGVLVRAKVGANWKNVKFALLKTSNKLLFTFNAQKANEIVELKWRPGNDTSCDSRPEQPLDIIDPKCGCFELYFELMEKGIKIFLNGSPLQKKSEVELGQEPEVAYVKMDADIEKLELNKTTWSVPNNGKTFELREFFATGVIKISGRFLKDAKRLTVSLARVKGEEISIAEAEECLRDKYNLTCSVVFNLNINLRQNNATFRRQICCIEGERIWAENDIKSFNTTQFVPGQTFELTINATKNSVIGRDGIKRQTDVYLVEQIPGMKAYTRINGDQPNFIWLSLEDGFLFSRPIIIEKN